MNKEDGMSTEKVSFIRSIGGRILLIFVFVSILAVGALALISLNKANNALDDAYRKQLASVGDLKANQLVLYFDRIMKDVEVVAGSEDVGNALEKLILYHEEMHIQPTAPYDMSSSADNLTRTYDEIYEEVNSSLKKYTEIYGYYDVYLVCAKHGHVMYSWGKGKDLGENVGSGQYKDSGLADAWRKAVSEGQPVLIDASSYAPSNGEPAMFAAAPVREGNKIVGVFVIHISNSQIDEIVQQRTGMGETGESYLVGYDSDGDKSLRSDRVVKDGKILDKKDDDIINKCLDEGLSGTDVKIGSTGAEELVNYLPVNLPDGIKWGIFSTIAMDEVDRPLVLLTRSIIIVAIIIILVVSLVALLLSRAISKPLLFLSGIAEEMSLGNFDVVIDKKLLKSRDETGLLSRSFDTMIENLRYKGGLLEEVAKGNLAIDIELASDKDVLGNALVGMAESLNEVFGEIKNSVEQLRSGSGQVSQSSQALSQGSTEQASSVEEISSSLTEINSQSRQNADNAGEASSLSKDSVNKAKNGNLEIEVLTKAMQDISASSEETKKVVKVIDDIAFQINLLALNANVEAARAGKYGKGFAVVADEVRNLAVRSAEASKESASMVEESIRSIEKGSESADKSAKNLEEIVEGISKVSSVLDEIAVASREQAQGIEQVNEGIEQINQVTQSNTASSEETAAAAEQLASQAEVLNNLVNKFQLKDVSESMSQKLSGGISEEYLQKLVDKELHKMRNADIGNGAKNPKDVIKLDDDDFGDF